MTQPFRYISLGAGVQSSAVLVMSALGLYGCPKADVAIFADTQDEPEYVYSYLATLKAWAGEHGIRVETVTAGSVSAHQLDPESTRSLIPAFTVGADGRASMLLRKCTQEHKIQPIERRVRELLGYQPRQRIKVKAEALIGISRDEAQRMKDSRTPWIKNRYPLIDAGLFRWNCIDIVERAGLPTPQKSACVICPFHDNAYWRELRDKHPNEFERACHFDSQIRDQGKAGVKSQVFLHRSLKPLREVDLEAPPTDQLNFGFGNECEGMCGV